jgi:two-component system nitrogen regulation response regulator GlnG
MSTIWIVDDEPAICWALRSNLEENFHQVEVFSAAEPVIKALKKHVPDLMLLDIRLPGLSGLELLERVKKDYPDLPIILMTAFGDLKTAVQAVQGSAFEYLTKPFDLEVALQSVQRALALRHLHPAASPNGDTIPNGYTKSSRDPGSTGDGKGSKSHAAELPEAETVLGKSPAMQAVYKQIAMAASIESIVLIEGEEGTGKNLVADRIHKFSQRRDKPLLMISAIPGKDLEFESELFGSGRSESDALQPLRTGLLELADEGTVLIDEVGAISLTNQLRLIRAIESQSFCRIGDTEPKTLRCRLLFTSSHSVKKLLAEGELDRRLASQLEVFRVELPPLRERRDDIPSMVHIFLNSRSLPAGVRITKQAIEELKKRNWPGNIRELRHTVEKAAVRSSGGMIHLEDLPTESSLSNHPSSHPESQLQLERSASIWTTEQLASKSATDSSDSGSNSSPEEGLPGMLYEEFLGVVEPALLKTVLDQLQGNRAAAASMLGLHRSTLRQKMRRYGLDGDK